MIERTGKRTLRLKDQPFVVSHAAAVGQKEGEGPLGQQFDLVVEDDRMGEKSWELAESHLQKNAIDMAVKKANLQKSDLDAILAGDLLNQCIGSSIASVDSNVPYLGLYGACSTMALGLALGACLIEGGGARRLLAAASSHFCSAERQYRFPLAYGGQRTPTAQWTATAAGAAILGKKGSSGLRVTHAHFGRMVEMGVKDANNMGAAMAPEEVNLDPYIRCTGRCVLLHKGRTRDQTLQGPIAPSFGNLVFGGNHNPAEKNGLICRHNFTVELDTRQTTAASYQTLLYWVSPASYRNDHPPVKRCARHGWKTKRRASLPAAGGRTAFLRSRRTARCFDRRSLWECPRKRPMASWSCDCILCSCGGSDVKQRFCLFHAINFNPRLPRRERQSKLDLPSPEM